MAPPTRLWGAHSPSTLAVARRKSSACIAFDLPLGREESAGREREGSAMEKKRGRQHDLRCRQRPRAGMAPLPRALAGRRSSASLAMASRRHVPRGMLAVDTVEISSQAAGGACGQETATLSPFL
jgi:hypothetical protein